MKEALVKLMDGQPASLEAVRTMMGELMQGAIDPIAAGAFLTLQARNGIDGQQLNAALDVMLKFAQRIEINDPDAIDNCGTGGDGGGGFNVSTTAAFVAAGAGHTVAKHGNRAVSSSCGSADLLESLGVHLDLSPDQVGHCIDEIGIGFMFAPVFHPAMRHAVPIRKALKVRTIFNMLGPLANPAGVRKQLIGVFAAPLTEIFAQAFVASGKTGMVVHGMDGSDEISLSHPTRISAVRNGTIHSYQFDPAAHGFKKIPPGSLPGGSLALNQSVFVEVLQQQKPGPSLEMVVLNAGFAMMTSDRYDQLDDAFQAARDAISSGRAWEKVESLIEWTRKEKAKSALKR